MYSLLSVLHVRTNGSKSRNVLLSSSVKNLYLANCSRSNFRLIVFMFEDQTDGCRGCLGDYGCNFSVGLGINTRIKEGPKGTQDFMVASSFESMTDSDEIAFICGPCTCSVPSQAAASLPLLPGTQSSLCTFKELGSTFPTAHRHRAQRGSAFTADAQLRISQNSRRTRGGLAQHCGRGFRFSVRLTHCLRPPGRDFSDYRESPVNLIRFGPQARKGASVKRAPASLLLRICGLCGHRCAAQGELGVFQDKIFTARSQRNAQILWILPVNICWDVYALGGSVRKLCRIGLWCSELTGLFC